MAEGGNISFILSVAAFSLAIFDVVIFANHAKMIVQVLAGYAFAGG